MNNALIHLNRIGKISCDQAVGPVSMGMLAGPRQSLKKTSKR